MVNLMGERYACAFFEEGSVERQGVTNFVLNTNDYRIGFVAEIRNGGLYFKPNWNYCKNKDRRYNAMRYQYKFIPLIREVAFKMRKKGMLYAC